ncbi:MAG TPA: ATP-binding cassette domain-containing protein [Steroidobacteraceae bacterium]|nr:ATP-binding cassette domain-containing protein [Steroidobacteraceae bacterium]HNS27513.1 ATP-binding cassette domain-containing protein [Steroidobacteraceae bacterium]
MTRIALLDAHLAFGLLPLLDGADLHVTAGERIGLIGRNGTGKSSLLAVLAGRQDLDAGEVQRRDGLSVALVEQEPDLPAAPTLGASLALRGGAERLDEAARAALTVRVTAQLDRFGLAPGQPSSGLSGGERKRAALALAFALEPGLLLLDEPTNHLDIAGIEQLEALAAGAATLVVVTHDRRFLDRVATRIVELDRGVLRSYPGNFAAYERAKTQELAAEAVANRRFDKFWKQEEAWIRQGVEARRTRNEGRVRRLEMLRLERSRRRERTGDVRFTLAAGDRSGRLVIELDRVSVSFGARPIVRDLSMRIMRGDRIGLIGPNGAGKTTLLRLMLGELEPDSGTVRTGSNLRVAYFDQLRSQLDPERTVAETISPGSDWVEVGGVRKHVTTYLAEFLFPSRRARSPVRMLSGGERHRLLLARLFAQPANLLVLDEPTNDLDMESLELLEETLQGYGGTLLLVSHDREFLDNVVTQTLVAEGDGRWREYVGGYSDWLAQRGVAPREGATSAAPVRDRTRVRQRFGYREQKELDALPAAIESLEAEKSALTAAMCAPDYHRAGPARARDDAARLAAIDHDIEAAMARWEELEARRAQ